MGSSLNIGQKKWEEAKENQKKTGGINIQKILVTPKSRDLRLALWAVAAAS